MALDTQQKRWGMISDGPPIPTGSFDRMDRLLFIDCFGVYFSWHIPNSRIFFVAHENRVFIVSYENRVYRVK